MRVELLNEGPYRVSVLLSLEEAQALRRFCALATPRDRTAATLDQWHEDSKIPQSFMFKMAALVGQS